MRNRAGSIWRNLILLYLSLLLVMAAWGTTGSFLQRRGWPALATETVRNGMPTCGELLGFWPPGRGQWQRVLQMALPGLWQSRRKRLTFILPGRDVFLSSSSVSSGSFWL